MMNEELCGMNERRLPFYSAFRIPHSALIIVSRFRWRAVSGYIRSCLSLGMHDATLYPDSITDS
jgi:hypothetical protein